MAIARALVGRPAIVLADEPTGNLDSATGASIMALIRELNADGATIVMITHDAGLADQLPRQIRVLDGQVVSDTGRDRGVLVAPGEARGRRGRRARCHACQGRTTGAEGRAAGGECWAARPAAARRAVRARIAIGTAAIVGVLGLSSSSQAGLLAEIDRLGTNLLTVEAGRSLGGGRVAAPAKRGGGSPTWTTSSWWPTPP